MPIILWLLGVPLTAILFLMLSGVDRFRFAAHFSGHPVDAACANLGVYGFLVPARRLPHHVLSRVV